MQISPKFSATLFPPLTASNTNIVVRGASCNSIRSHLREAKNKKWNLSFNNLEMFECTIDGEMILAYKFFSVFSRTRNRGHPGFVGNQREVHMHGT